MLNIYEGRYKVIKGLTFKKLIHNYHGDLIFWLINNWKKILIIAIALFCLFFYLQIRSCVNHHADKNKTIIQSTDNLKDTLTWDNATKGKKIIRSETKRTAGAFKGAKPSEDIIIPPSTESTRVRVRHEEEETPEIIVDGDKGFKIVYNRAPLIKVQPKFYVGFWGEQSNKVPSLGFYGKFQTLEIGKFGIGWFIGMHGWNVGYGLTTGYMVKRFMVDVMFDIRQLQKQEFPVGLGLAIRI